jgi:hypothetical protein
MDFCNVQVTKWIDTEVDIKTWNDFLKQKGYETDVRMSKSSDGKHCIVYTETLPVKKRGNITRHVQRFKNEHD